MSFGILPIALIGGLLNRWRGGWKIGPNGSHTTRRIVLSLATGAVAASSFDFLTAGVLFSVAFYIGLVPGWAKWMRMGRGDNDFWTDWKGMTGRGLVLTAPAGAVLFPFIGPAAFIFALSGFAMGALYELGWNIPTVRSWLQQGPEWGELLFGTWIWLMLILTGMAL